MFIGANFIFRRAFLRVASDSIPIKWKYNRIKLSNKNISYFECQAQVLGETIVGYGEHENIYVAVQKSFSEAFERTVFQFYERFSKQDRPYSTNGFAAHPDLESAMELAEAELVERHVVLLAWKTLTGWNPIFSRQENNGVHLYELKNSSPYRIFCGFNTSGYGLVFDSIAIDKRHDERLAINKLISSLERSVLVASEFSDSGYTETIPLSAGPEDIRAYFRNPNTKKLVSFINEASRSEVLDVTGVDQVRLHILLQGAWNTPFVVRAYNDNWPKLEWGVGTTSPINPWCLPLA